jgi:hypothetical protein
MKYIIPLLVILLFSLSALHAQDTVTYSDQQTDAEYAQEEAGEENYDEEETTEHTFVAPNELTQTKNYSKEKLDVKKFDQKKWKEVVGSTDYDEKPKKKKKEKAEEESEDSPEQDSSDSSITPWGGEMLKIVAYAAIIAFVIFIIYFVTKNASIGKSNRKIIQEEDTVTTVENIQDLDVQSLLQKTIAEGNLRLAVRLYFLGLLKKLNEGGIIRWKKDKTNREYLTELYIKQYYFEEVKRLTLAYEQVWYGEHRLSSELYQKLFAEFETLDQKLNSPKAS